MIIVILGHSEDTSTAKNLEKTPQSSRREGPTIRPDRGFKEQKVEMVSQTNLTCINQSLPEVSVVQPNGD